MAPRFLLERRETTHKHQPKLTAVRAKNGPHHAPFSCFSLSHVITLRKARGGVCVFLALRFCVVVFAGAEVRVGEKATVIECSLISPEGKICRYS